MRLRRAAPRGVRIAVDDSRVAGTRRWIGFAALVCACACGPLGVAVAQVPLGDDRVEAAAEGEAEPAPQSDAATPSTESAPVPGADAPPPSGGAPPPSGASDVGLDQLLRLPNSLDFKEERRGGGGAADWRRRFAESELAVLEARKKLDEAEIALSEAGTAGGGQWQIAPPGQQASSEAGPISIKLREDLRRARTGLEEAERQHRALVVEADLAEVPMAWRQNGVR